MKKLLLLGLLLLTSIPGVRAADEMFPREGWKEAANPLAYPEARPGGEIAIYAGDYPKSFNYYLDQNVFSAELFGAMYESLLGQHPLTLDYEPGLAERWSISEDKRTFTFWLDPRAKWSDGRPVTAEDVKWTFDAVMKPENITGPHKIYLSRFETPEVLDERTIRFHAKEIHWQNLDALASYQILPRHAFAEADFNKINFEFPVVSGSYRLGEIQEGVLAKLERRADWWNRDSIRSRSVGNFQTLVFKFFAERDNAFEAFKKGAIDLFPVYTAHLWATQTEGERYDRNWVIKQRIFNYNPVGFQGFAMNGRRPPFDDVHVRRALAHLLDREKMNATLMHNQYFLHRSYYEDLYSAERPCKNELVEFDKDRARKSLAEAGWTVNPKSGLLEKDGQPFRFRFLSRDAATDKFLVIYKEALKDAGIEMLIEKKDWAAWAKDMDEFNFDMTWAAWSGGLRKDPEPMWSSVEADKRSGQNITGFRNDEVDALIAAQRENFDIQQRHELCRRIDRILTAEFPYILLWNINYTRLLYWNKFGVPPTVLGKYGDERAAYWYWWYDEDAAAELKDAMNEGLPLPRKPAAVRFDEVFQTKSEQRTPNIQRPTAKESEEPEGE
ncbi:MAG: extracellular solute-binding protein [Verrucomicrobia bacterium]|nr:extracellular solute-binding protein [Verrucomicrobiota bacterium]